MRENTRLTAEQRDAAVDDLIALADAVDQMLQAQAKSDTGYFPRAAKTQFSSGENEQIQKGVLAAYRYQYIVSGVQNQRFGEILGGMMSPAQGDRIGAALKPILEG